MPDLSKKAQASGRSRKAPAEKPAAEPESVVVVTEPTPLLVSPQEIITTSNVRAKETNLADLTASVRKHGVLEPIGVRVDRGHYTLVFGARRLAAALAAKLDTVPVTVVSAEASDMLLQLTENMLREDLDPIDQARAYVALMESEGWTQEQLGRYVGLKQSTISNAVRMLEQPEEVQTAVQAGTLTPAAAKSMASLDPEVQQKVAAAAVEQKMSSRDVDSVVQRYKEDERRKREWAKADTERRDSFLEQLKKAKTPKKALIVVDKESDAAWLAEQGYANARVFDFDTDHRQPDWKCDCKAVMPRQWSERLERVCVVQEHAETAKAEKASAAREVQAARQKKVAAARKVVRSASISDTGDLTIDGLRMALYVTLMLADRERTGSLPAFVRRHGGEWPDHGAYGDGSVVWECIESMQRDDVVSELSGVLVGQLVPNVWSDMAYGVKQHAGFRRWAVAQYGLDKETVWGVSQAQPLVVDRKDGDDSDEDDGDAQEVEAADEQEPEPEPEGADTEQAPVG